MNREVRSSSEETSDTESESENKLSSLLWHKIKQSKPSSKTAATKPNSSPSLAKPSESTDWSEPQGDKELSSRPRMQLPQVDVGCLLASMSSKKQESIKKPCPAPSTSQSVYENRLQKDLKKLKSTQEPCQTKWQQKKEAKVQRSQWSDGKGGWGAMRATEVTKKKKDDLALLSMRSTIDPTRHYKHTDLKTPKFFQMGEIQENPYSFYQDRNPKKKRKRTLVDELMADQDFKKRLKHQYKEVMATTGQGKAIFQGRAPRKIKIQRKHGKRK
ncbi:hypothetical protein ACOMHN_001922 [Nucella lapillus]